MQLVVTWNIAFYLWPLLLIILYRRGYCKAKSLPLLAQICATIALLVALSLGMRAIGRASSVNYLKFIKALEAAKANATSQSAQEHLRMFDFEFYAWPVDFDAKHVSG